MVYYSGDPHADYDRHDARQQRELERQPKCTECREHIQEDECFEFDGKLICPVCLKENHQRETADFVR